MLDIYEKPLTQSTSNDRHLANTTNSDLYVLNVILHEARIKQDLKTTDVSFSSHQFIFLALPLSLSVSLLNVSFYNLDDSIFYN